MKQVKFYITPKEGPLKGIRFASQPALKIGVGRFVCGNEENSMECEFFNLDCTRIPCMGEHVYFVKAE